MNNPNTKAGVDEGLVVDQFAKRYPGPAFGESVTTNVPLPSGKRMDAVSEARSMVMEVKKDGYTRTKRATDQAKGYVDELSEVTGKKMRGEIRSPEPGVFTGMTRQQIKKMSEAEARKLVPKPFRVTREIE